MLLAIAVLAAVILQVPELIVVILTQGEFSTAAYVTGYHCNADKIHDVHD